MISREAIRFGLVGLANTITGYSAIWVLHYVFGINPSISNFLGYVIGGVLSYCLNRTFTFASSRPHSQTIPRFFLAVAFCFLLNLAVLNAALLAFNVPVWLAQGFAVASYTLAFFFISRQFVFRESPAAGS